MSVEQPAFSLNIPRPLTPPRYGVAPGPHSSIPFSPVLFKQPLSLVNYVRENKQTDVHILYVVLFKIAEKQTYVTFKIYIHLLPLTSWLVVLQEGSSD